MQEVRAKAASDEELVVRARAGEARAFEELVRRHTASVYSLARYLCHGDAQDAKDTFQNALLKAYRHLASFRGEAQFSSWLTRIAVNECLLHQRRQRRERNWVRLDERLGEERNLPVELADTSGDPEELYARQQFHTILRHCLAELPDGYREAFVLQAIEGLSIQEIATRLGLSSSAAKSLAFRARLQVQRSLIKKFCRDDNCYWPGGGINFGSRFGKKRRETSCLHSR